MHELLEYVPVHVCMYECIAVCVALEQAAHIYGMLHTERTRILTRHTYSCST